LTRTVELKPLKNSNKSLTLLTLMFLL